MNKPTLITLIVAALMPACQPGSDSDSEGALKLTFADPALPNLQFRLENGTENSVSLRGWKSSDADVITPESYSVTCIKNDASQAMNELPPANHQGSRSEAIEIQPGSEARLNVGIELLQPNLDSSCNLKLRLESGAMVISNEFAL